MVYGRKHALFQIIWKSSSLGTALYSDSPKVLQANSPTSHKRGGEQGKREGGEEGAGGGRRGGGRREKRGREEGEEGEGGGRRGGGRRERGGKKGGRGKRGKFCARFARAAPEGRRETRGREGRGKEAGGGRGLPPVRPLIRVMVWVFCKTLRLICEYSTNS